MDAEEEAPPPVADAKASARISVSAPASAGKIAFMMTSLALSMATGMASQMPIAFSLAWSAMASSWLTHLPSASVVKPGMHVTHLSLPTMSFIRSHVSTFFLKS